MSVGFTIYVTDHAMWRAAERFPRFDTLLIEEEVREAITAQRFATWDGRPDTLYVSTADGERVYALRPHVNHFVVTTVLHRREAA